jgi:hypothetical protein
VSQYYTDYTMAKWRRYAAIPLPADQFMARGYVLYLLGRKPTTPNEIKEFNDIQAAVNWINQKSLAWWPQHPTGYE